MVTRENIEAEAGWVQSLLKWTNPTGAMHSAVPWAPSGAFEITAAGAPIAYFRHTEDRDLALYFTNVHPGIIALLRSAAASCDFIAAAAGGEPGLRAIAHGQAEQLRIYAELFCRLGKPVPDPEGQAHD